MIRALSALLVVFLLSFPAMAEEPKRIVALGDSLTAGYGLPPGEDFATKLQEALIAEGIPVQIENAGISGDTTAGGLARLERVIEGPRPPDLVIIALGANDMLRSMDPAIPRKNLAAILDILKERKIPALLLGMKSFTHMGLPFRGSFEKIFHDLSDEYDVPLYPFFLKGVAMNQELNLPDGLHPNQKGIAVMVKNITPVVEDALND